MGRKLFVIAVVVAVAAAAGYLVQRRYMPTCGQVASHAVSVLEEANALVDGVSTGQVRQRCIDQDWSRTYRAELMRADTEKQLAAVGECLEPSGKVKQPVTASCTDFYQRLGD